MTIQPQSHIFVEATNTQTGSINANIDHDNFSTPHPCRVKEALWDINNQINDPRNIIGNQVQQVNERLEKLQSNVSSAVSNLQGRVLESKMNDFINDKDQGSMTGNLVWYLCSLADMLAVEHIQNYMLRMVYEDYDSPYEDLLAKCHVYSRMSKI